MIPLARAIDCGPCGNSGLSLPLAREAADKCTRFSSSRSRRGPPIRTCGE